MSNDLITETKTYSLSTRTTACTLLNGEYKSFVEFPIPDMIYKDDTIEYIQYSIPYAIVPVSFFQINETNNVLKILRNGFTLTQEFDYGNYNANLFMKRFNEYFSFLNWTIELNQLNSTFLITSPTDPITLLPSSIDYVMGYTGTVSSVLINNIHTLKMKRPCNFFSLPRICLRCPQLSNQGYMESKIESADIILSIPNNAKPNGQIVFQNNIFSKQFLKADRLEKLTFMLTDDDGNFINFNGISSFFIIQFDIFRKSFLKVPPFRDIQNTVERHFLFDGQ